MENIPKHIRNLLSWRRIIAVIFVSGLIWCGVLVALGMSIQHYGEDDQAQSSDAIIVLGSGLRRDGRPGDALYRRSVWAARLYQQGLSKYVICTGGIGEGHTRSEANACMGVLLENGVPADAIYLDEQSRSTEENAIYARQIMEENNWIDAILVTDSFHMLRAQWIFSDIGIQHHRSPVPRDWVRDYFYNRHVTREILALHWQAFKEVLNLPFTRVG